MVDKEHEEDPREGDIMKPWAIRSERSDPANVRTASTHPLEDRDVIIIIVLQRIIETSVMSFVVIRTPSSRGMMMSLKRHFYHHQVPGDERTRGDDTHPFYMWGCVKTIP